MKRKRQNQEESWRRDARVNFEVEILTAKSPTLPKLVSRFPTVKHYADFLKPLVVEEGLGQVAAGLRQIGGEEAALRTSQLRFKLERVEHLYDVQLCTGLFSCHALTTLKPYDILLMKESPPAGAVLSDPDSDSESEKEDDVTPEDAQAKQPTTIVKETKETPKQPVMTRSLSEMSTQSSSSDEEGTSEGEPLSQRASAAEETLREVKQAEPLPAQSNSMTDNDDELTTAEAEALLQSNESEEPAEALKGQQAGGRACKHCTFENPPDALSCVICGEAFVSDDKVCLPQHVWYVCVKIFCMLLTYVL